jgi:hypothetical protein
MNPVHQVHVEHPALPEVLIEKWLSPKEVAGHFGLSQFSAYRWISEGLVPENYVRHCGKWRLRVHPSVIPLLEEKFARAHGVT